MCGSQKGLACVRGSSRGSAGCAARILKLWHAQDAIDRLVRLYGNVCCHGSIELAELELKSELRSQLKLERCAQGFLIAGNPRRGHECHSAEASTEC